MTLRAPVPPDVPADQRATGSVPLRYEDVSQEGRLMPLALSPMLGDVVWRNLVGANPGTVALFQQGVVAILTRIVMESLESPISIALPTSVEGRLELAHAVDANGDVSKILVNMWAEATAPRARTYGPKPEGAMQPIVAGRVFAEHVFTRLFAPPDQRKVLSLDAPGLPAVPERRVRFASPAETMLLPEGAIPLDDAPSDAATIAFGLGHTDSNHHVNSLVYPRLFEDAALRRIAALGRTTSLAATYVEAAYRKPSFAGERLRIVLRTFEHEGKIGAAGAFVEHDATTTDRARAYVRILFDR